MIYSIFKAWAGLSALLIILNCSPAYSEVYMSNAPQFSEQNQAVDIQAHADGSPESVILKWVSEDKQGQVEMMPDLEMEYWSATIPAHEVQGALISYTISADYGQTPAITSSEYIIYVCPGYMVLKPQTMVLNAKVLVQKRWNSDDDAFGLSNTHEGPEVGPASIAYDNGSVYLLDSAKGRILSFDNEGKKQSSISIPTTVASDLVIDPSDSSLIVVSQLEDKIYRVKHGASTRILLPGLKRGLVYPAQFSYDASTETLFAQGSARHKLVGVMHKGKRIQADSLRIENVPQVLSEARGNTILLGLSDSLKVIAVTFDKPVACIEESLADSNGVIWVLYTLEGDYRIRRLVRVDTSNGLAETAETNIWFSFDATRRMALTQKGVVLFAEDMDEGKIVIFDYNGGI